MTILQSEIAVGSEQFEENKKTFQKGVDKSKKFW